MHDSIWWLLINHSFTFNLHLHLHSHYVAGGSHIGQHRSRVWVLKGGGTMILRPTFIRFPSLC